MRAARAACASLFATAVELQAAPPGLQQRVAIQRIGNIELPMGRDRQRVMDEPELGDQVVAMLEVSMKAQRAFGFFDVIGEKVEQRGKRHAGSPLNSAYSGLLTK